MKEWAWRVGEAVFWTFTALWAAGNLFNWMTALTTVGRTKAGNAGQRITGSISAQT